ncbi:RNA-directed DNA polymerase, eukaryota, partial [Tanacetum coccineum]
MGKVKDINVIPNLRSILSKEGFPQVNVWYRGAYLKVGNKWGKALDIKDNSGSSFARKRLCVLTKQPDTILENFKESNYISDDDSVQGDINQPEGLILEDDSDVAEVSETVPSLSHPPGFTPLSSDVRKDENLVEDAAASFIAIYGTWLPNNAKILFVAVYAPQLPSCKRALWEYISILIGHWKGEAIVMGDFNEVRSINERLGSVSDYYHSWFTLDGFDEMVEQAWLSFSFSDSNGMIRFKKKLQGLKAIIRQWVKEKKLQQSKVKNSLKKDLQDIDKGLDCGISSDSILLKRLDLLRQLHDINHMEAKESAQRSKIKWAIEGDENSKFFHGI